MRSAWKSTMFTPNASKNKFPRIVLSVGDRRNFLSSSSLLSVCSFIRGTIHSALNLQEKVFLHITEHLMD